MYSMNIGLVILHWFNSQHRLVAAAAAEAVITAVEEEAAWAIDSKGNSEQQYQRFGKVRIITLKLTRFTGIFNSQIIWIGKV